LAIEELIGRLERDANARVAAVEARAQAEVQAIEAAAEQASAKARGDALAGRRAQRRSRLDLEVAEARQAARAERLRAEHALLERVLSRAEELLERMDRDDAYLSTMPDRLDEAFCFVDERGARVRCRAGLAPAVRAAIAGRGDVTVEEVPAMPVGFRVIARDGSVEVDDTLRTRLEQLRPRLLMELLAEVGT